MKANGSKDVEPNEPNDVPTPKYPIHEFMIDFLGGLVPGSLFIVGASVALLPPLYLIFCLSNKSKAVSLTVYFDSILSSTQHTPNMIWILAFALFVAISYELGHLFFRRDPKNPDRASFEKLVKKEQEKANKKKYTKKEYIERLKSELACTDKEGCQFPYVNLRDYIGKRGHCHLCPFVVWENDVTLFRRSKTFINLLKIRLKYYYPQKCSVIIRNEAHVRLASSSWYIAYTLRICSIIGVILVGFSILIDIIAKITSEPYSIYFPFLIPPILVLLAGEYIRTRIEHFIHYQRLREIFYVLETAFTAFRGKWKLLDPPFSNFDDDFNATKCEDFNCTHHPHPLKAIIKGKAEQHNISEEKVSGGVFSIFNHFCKNLSEENFQIIKSKITKLDDFLQTGQKDFAVKLGSSTSLKEKFEKLGLEMNVMKDFTHTIRVFVRSKCDELPKNILSKVLE